jgi:predicted double-glycine peptidase
MRLAERVARRFTASTLLPVPIIPQSSDFSCGSACLLAVLHYWKGDNIGVSHEADLWKPLAIDTEAGAEPEQIVALAGQFGLAARHVLDLTQVDLQAALGKGQTVILLLQAWRERPVGWLVDWEDGHYIVLVGMDDANAFFMDPSIHTSYGWMPREELDLRWHSPDTEGMPQFGAGVIIEGSAGARSFPAAPQRMR